MKTQTDRHTDRQTDRHTDTQTQRQTDTQKDRQTDTDTNRQADKHRQTDRLYVHSVQRYHGRVPAGLRFPIAAQGI